MQYKYFSKNGVALPASHAVIPLENIAYAYGYGVYETIRLDKGIIYFADEHLARLQGSAAILGLEHPFDNELIGTAITELIGKNQVQTCNLKLLLIGGTTKAQASLYVMCLNPLFPNRKLYSIGAKLITYEAVRPFAHAKSLNMLQSYLAYREAKENDAYDALLINRDGNITEGTRNNFFCIKGKTIVSPPEDEILLGVMRKVVLKTAMENGFNIEYGNISTNDLPDFDSAFLTSTSAKVMPVQTIDGNSFTAIPPELKLLMQKTAEFLKTCNGKL